MQFIIVFYGFFFGLCGLIHAGLCSSVFFKSPHRFVGITTLLMSQKRYPDDSKAQAETNSDDKRRRVPTTFYSVVVDAVRKNYAEKFLEPMIRRVVKEELELIMEKYCAGIERIIRHDREENFFSQSRVLQLKFVNSLSLPIYTGTRIMGVGNSSLEIALINELTGKYVDFEPESSAKVEILVLEGDFDGEDCDSWTCDAFCNNILREREGRKPLLAGDVVLNLKDGAGLVGEIYFTDNSSWTRSRKFRLGARVVDKCPTNRIREAKSEPFIVRDHRGELYKKHHPPMLSDEVWRLVKIGKDGAFHNRLTQNNINTVKDFLILFNIDAPKLLTILGTGMSTKMWEVIVKHAQTCILDNTMYLYQSPVSPEEPDVVFNVVGQLLGIVSDSQYVSVDKLSETKKLDAHKSIVSAFDNWERVSVFNDGSKFFTSAKTDFLLESGVWGENLDFGSEKSSSLPSEMNTPLVSYYGDQFNQPFFNEDDTQFLETDVQNLNFENYEELGDANKTNGQEMLLAKKRWRKVKSVFQWLCSRRIAAK